MGDEIIRLDQISYSYRNNKTRKNILSECNLSVNAGESIAVLGESGAGKSTILGILGGLLKPSAGQYTFKKNILETDNTRAMADFRYQHTGYVFQNYCLLPQLSLIENVLLAAQVNGKSGAESRENAAKTLDNVGLQSLYDRKPNQISGGQAQRVAIARALLRKPEILLADEPTGNLDDETAASIISLLLEHTEKGGILILVTHSESIANKMQRKLKIRDGKINEIHKNG